MCETITLRPFHETIVDTIGHCSTFSDDEFVCLLRLVQTTKIPSGHDTIIVAINRRLDLPDTDTRNRHNKCRDYAIDVIESIRKQKKIAEEERLVNKGTGDDLDVLQQDAEQLLSLLKNRGTKTAMWHELWWQRMGLVHSMLSRLLGK